MDETTEKELRAARVAHVLARAVRAGEVNALDAARILRHELRRLNTNRSHLIPTRSLGAQASIDKYSPDRPPRNGSGEALHADHVYLFQPDTFFGVVTLEGWLTTLRRLATVVVVTASENYALEKLEKTGADGPSKYEAAGIRFHTALPY